MNSGAETFQVELPIANTGDEHPPLCISEAHLSTADRRPNDDTILRGRDGDALPGDTEGTGDKTGLRQGGDLDLVLHRP